MKECPVCHAMAFDDASRCFGCLYRFEEGAEKKKTASGRNAESQNRPVQFLLSLVPKAEGAQLSWQCSVEAVEEALS